MAAQVFRPGYTMATVTPEEAVEAEIRAGRLQMPTNPPKKTTKRGDEEDDDDEQKDGKKSDDEDDDVDDDAKLRKAREWDNFKDDNPRGWGNTMNR